MLALGPAVTLIELGLLLATVAGLVWWTRRTPASHGEAIRLSAEHAVHVVDVAGRRWLIGTGPAGPPALIAELPPERGEPRGD